MCVCVYVYLSSRKVNAANCRQVLCARVCVTYTHIHFYVILCLPHSSYILFYVKSMWKCVCAVHVYISLCLSRKEERSTWEAEMCARARVYCVHACCVEVGVCLDRARVRSACV